MFNSSTSRVPARCSGGGDASTKTVYNKILDRFLLTNEHLLAFIYVMNLTDLNIIITKTRTCQL